MVRGPQRVPPLPPTEFFQDAVVPDGLANHQQGSCSWRRMLGCSGWQVNETERATGQGWAEHVRLQVSVTGTD